MQRKRGNEISSTIDYYLNNFLMHLRFLKPFIENSKKLTGGGRKL